MYLRSELALTAALLCLAGAVPAHRALSAEQARSLQEQLVGTWILDDLQSVTWDGDDRNPFGSAPKGRMILDRTGHVICLIIGGDRPKFLLGDRLTGTAQENQAAVQSTQAFFGTYSVNEQDKTVVFHVERSSFPNWDATDQASTMTIDGDELRQVKSGPHDSRGYATWKRVQELRTAQQR
jgi:hypothetical protein